MSIYLTGASGFIGKNLITFFNDYIPILKVDRNINTDINEQVVIHLAGKAHDLKNTSSWDEYYKANTELTKKVFDAFLVSKAKVFITISSVKAVADEIDGELTEEYIPNPITHYGKSKLLAEDYILSKEFPQDKRIYILRPCMIHGVGNKGNLNLLYNITSKGMPWPLGKFENKRSFCNIDNLCFIINELIENDHIPSGVYNISDDDPLSTNELIYLITESLGKKTIIWNIPIKIIKIIFKLGDLIRLPFNTENLIKLTQNYIVSNSKIKKAIGKSLPYSTKDGLLKTFKSFN
jgi:nucleoside-diphosphate-sugar epimerase